MKKNILFIALAVTTLFTACNSDKKSSSDENEAKPTATVERVKTSNGTINEPIHITTAEFKQLVANYEDSPSEWKYLGDKPAIIDFWADWCRPCHMIAPVLDELAKEYAGQIYIYKVDTDAEKELGSVFGIRSIPTLLFVPMQGEPRAEVGVIPKERFVERIDGFLLTDS